MSIQVTPIPRLTTLTTPAFTLGTANTAGSAITGVASDSTLLVFDATLPDAITFGQSGSAGSATVSSRRDHAHATASVTTASQAEMEAASSTTAFVTPGRAQYSPVAAKVWGRTNTSNSLTGEYNMTGLTNHGTGDNTWTYDTDFSNALYVTLVSMGGTERIVNADAQAQGSCRVRSWVADSPYSASNAQTNFVAFGDQA